MLARGGTVNTVDERLADVVFLANHPAWTWRDLESTPEDVIDIMRQYERQQARANA